MSPTNPALKKRIHYQPSTEEEINSLVARVRSSGGEGIGFSSDDYLAAERQVINERTVCGRSDKFRKNPPSPEQSWLDKIKQYMSPVPRKLRTK